MDAPEAEPIPLSALQHAVYCPRQAALIHLERLWAENRFTAEGAVLHAVADKGGRRQARYWAMAPALAWAHSTDCCAGRGGVRCPRWPVWRLASARWRPAISPLP